jgi:hypothetical protein
MEKGIDAGQNGFTSSKINLRCPICGADLYATDQWGDAIIFHCSSSKARFWNYLRGTSDLLQAKRHWDLSKKKFPLDSK